MKVHLLEFHTEIRGEQIMVRETFCSEATKARALQTLFVSRDFQLLSLSEGLWLLGSQFYFIALPWLIMQRTASVTTLGAIYTLAAVPRLGLAALGGALCDRVSLKTLMLLATITRTLYLALLAWCVLSGNLTLWMLFAFGFSYGVMEAFFHPARRTAVPLLAPDNLQRANAFTYGIEQVMGLAGPALAGVVIASFSRSEKDVHGIGIAFVIDALLTLGAVVAVSFMGRLKITTSPVNAERTPGFITSIRQGIVHAWLHRETKTLLFMLAVLNLFIISPVLLGLPALVDSSLAGGSKTLGLLSSCFAGGMLLGTVLAGGLPKPRLEHKNIIFAVVFGVSTLSVVLLFTTGSRPLAALATFTVGVLVSYFNVMATTWLQHCTPPQLMGRMMGFLAMK
jgi:MFS family permease